MMEYCRNLMMSLGRRGIVLAGLLLVALIALAVMLATHLSKGATVMGVAHPSLCGPAARAVGGHFGIGAGVGTSGPPTTRSSVAFRR